VERKRNISAQAINALLEGLNPAPRCAATYGIDAEEGRPPLLIAAGAGTGKAVFQPFDVSRRRVLRARMLSAVKTTAYSVIAVGGRCSGASRCALPHTVPDYCLSTSH
jgi:hypothetical protein